MGCPDRIPVISGDRDIFGKTFINTVLTDGGGIMMQQIKQLTAALAVVMVFRRYNGQIGTFSQGIGDRFSGADAVSNSSGAEISVNSMSRRKKLHAVHFCPFEAAVNVWFFNVLAS